MKKIFVIFIAVMLLAGTVFNASATTPEEYESIYVADFADVLTYSQEEAIYNRIAAVKKEWNQDVFVVIFESLEEDISYGAENVLKELQIRGDTLGDPGVLLLLSLEERDWYLQYTDTDDKLPASDVMSEYFLDDFGDNDFYEGIIAFVDGVEKELSFPLGRNLIIALVVGFVIAFIVVSSMKGKLKTVHNVDHARDYVRAGSFNLEKSRDLYLYSTVTRVARPKNNSSGRSGGGSGRSGGGKF